MPRSEGIAAPHGRRFERILPGTRRPGTRRAFLDQGEPIQGLTVALRM